MHLPTVREQFFFAITYQQNAWAFSDGVSDAGRILKRKKKVLLIVKESARKKKEKTDKYLSKMYYCGIEIQINGD